LVADLPGRLGGSVRVERMVYGFVLKYSNWKAVTFCFWERVERLTISLQNASWELGCVPRKTC